jgi:hypothetical protein
LKFVFLIEFWILEMPAYIISKNITVQTHNQYQDYFDSSDQEKWANLLNIAARHNSANKLSKFPPEVPGDLNLWLELYTLVSNSNFAIENEELSSSSVQMQLMNDPDDVSGEYVNITLDVDT